MARVNHKKVKRLLMQKRSIITDRQFFTSRLFAGHLEDIAIAQTRRHKYNRRVHVQMIWNPKDESVIAQTNNASILINAGHSLVTKEHRTRSDRYCMICGLFAHELGHVLFTDFLAMQTYVKHLVAYKWFPRPPVLKNYGDKHREEALWEYAKKEPQNLEWLIRIAHDIGNIIDHEIATPLISISTKLCKGGVILRHSCFFILHLKGGGSHDCRYDVKTFPFNHQIHSMPFWHVYITIGLAYPSRNGVLGREAYSCLRISIIRMNCVLVLPYT